MPDINRITGVNLLFFQDDKAAYLKWNLRLSIACGIARGIRYLHLGKEKPLIHRDIKSANVLLDEGFAPKVSN